jgi:hypothetical protein
MTGPDPGQRLRELHMPGLDEDKSRRGGGARASDLLARARPRWHPLDDQAEGADTTSALLQATRRQACPLGVEVEARVGRGRTHRHALLTILDGHEFAYSEVMIVHAGNPEELAATQSGSSALNLT